MVTVAAFIAGLLQSSAAAAPVTAQLTSSYAGTVGLRAYGGLVVWSARRGDGGWALMQWRRGHVTRVPVAGRDVPFDADVGPSVTGRPVVTYSRCVVDPDGAPEGLQLAPDWNHSRGCRIYVYDPHTRRERRAALPRPAGSSDTTPTIWRGELAFVRRVNQHFPSGLGVGWELHADWLHHHRRPPSAGASCFSPSKPRATRRIAVTSCFTLREHSPS
jgi:hypothetical protein